MKVIQHLWKKFKAQTTIEQANAIWQAVLASPEGDVVEVGSASGGTTIVLITAAKIMNKNVISVDPYPSELEGKVKHITEGLMNGLKEEFKNNILNGQYDNIVQINKSLPDCIDKIPDNLSVVFIDGLHEYDNVANEVDLLYQKLAFGGVMCIHDIKWKKGQLSATKEGAVCNILNKLKEYKFSYIDKSVDNLFIGIK